MARSRPRFFEASACADPRAVAAQVAELVLGEVAAVVRQSADQRALAVIDAAGGDEAQERSRAVMGQRTAAGA